MPIWFSGEMGQSFFNCFLNVETIQRWIKLFGHKWWYVKIGDMVGWFEYISMVWWLNVEMVFIIIKMVKWWNSPITNIVFGAQKVKWQYGRMIWICQYGLVVKWDNNFCIFFPNGKWSNGLYILVQILKWWNGEMVIW